MYSSLHKVDLVVTADDGPVCIQTDHRTCEEIEAQPELSVVFAVTRLLTPGLADAAHRRVQYACAGGAPGFLRDVVRACGATLLEHGETALRAPPGPADLDAVARLAHDALMALGRAVLGRHGVDATREGLEHLEAAMRDGEAPDLEDDEIHYYEQLVELAAAGGVVVAAGNEHARWTITEHLISTVPLALDLGANRLANVFGRAERLFAGEVEVGPSALVGMHDDATRSADPAVVGILKPPSWCHDRPFPVLVEPLIRGDGVPILAYAHDHPRSVSYLNAEQDGVTLEAARDQAQAFYRAIEVTVERLADDLPLWLVTGDYYAPEKLLDRAFARELHVRFEAETLVVGLPARGVAGIVPVKDDPREASLLIASFVQRAQERSPPADRISSLPFLMMNGEISGYVAIDGGDDAPEPPRKRGFWRRLLGN